ncbi:PC-esterase domain-containing protein 1A isoform X2 [Microcaecilia unicolor]|uniref:PC-esterase domain-containing protein 1A-like isoform X2 n=1 Tax=Microcaecilia unicolor TaxID=1415580 RepID=A0A6P7WUI4_9AMPH|nr:PC-esterase domain-containing protein 1A-like isoform X2 [Microcaecilia unicolor]
MTNFTVEEAQQLFHNKFVVVLGDSIQRSVYKDLVTYLQKNDYLTNSQLKEKGELSFEHDFRVEGGELHNGLKYREVRQYRTDHHLVRFYFLTRVYSDYLESILADFKAGPQPDVVIINSCLWDVTRYGDGKVAMDGYRDNLEKFFSRLDEVILPECLLIWNTAMPLAHKLRGGFLSPELQYKQETLRVDVIEGNYYGATLASYHKFDVLDLHYFFRFDDQHRLGDGIHWNCIVHRKITQLLLTHIADAWGVEVPKKKPITGPCNNEKRKNSLQWCNQPAVQYSHMAPAVAPYPPPYRGPMYDENSEYSACWKHNGMRPIQVGYRPPLCSSGPSTSYQCGEMNSPFCDDTPCLGYTSFEHACSLGNGFPRGLPSNKGASMRPNTSFANFSNFPVQKFGSFPTHMVYPPASQWNQGDSSCRLVMRRPLQQRKGGPPRPRQYALPYGRY